MISSWLPGLAVWLHVRCHSLAEQQPALLQCMLSPVRSTPFVHDSMSEAIRDNSAAVLQRADA
jgi:hypothetical protein